MKSTKLSWGLVFGLPALAVWVGAPAQAQVLSGAVSGDRFGTSVAWAGDVNNDSYQDFLVGIPSASVGQGRPGRVNVYLGRFGSYPTTPSRILTGEISGDGFGSAVSGAGDVNNDGFDDFLVGAPTNDDAGSDAGKIYLYLGGNSLPSSPARTWVGSLPGARFGTAVAGGFDFNKDGKGDFAAGAPDYNGSGLRSGEVRIYLGASSTASITNPFTLQGDQANWSLGRSLDPAGDVDHDGFGDLVAGAPQNFDFNPGQAVVWFGQSSTSTTPSRLLIAGEQSGDRFGWDVSGAGDVNGDGFDDILVGAPGQDSAGLNKGAVYLFRGGSSPNAVSDWKAVGEVSGDSLGSAVDGGFDWNGDGTPDIAAGAPGGNVPASDAGEVRVYFGKATPATSADLVFRPQPPVPGFEAGDAFGSAVRFAGSYNGDSRSEILVGAPPGNGGAGAAAGYVNFLADPDFFTPVRLLSLEAHGVAQGIEVTWQLADAWELAGVRLLAAHDGQWAPIHTGWLDPGLGSYVYEEEAEAPSGYRLQGLDRQGNETTLGEVAYVTEGRLPLLGRPLANPFRTDVRIPLTAPGGPVRVAVWDVAGREVRLLEARPGPARLDLVWDGRDDAGRALPAGVYFVRATAGGARALLKLIKLP